MNFISTINRYRAEQSTIETETSELYQSQRLKLSILPEKFYETADKIAKISGLESIVEALLSDEQPSQVPIEAFLAIWKRLIRSTKTLFPLFDSSTIKQLRSVFKQLDDLQSLSARQITTALIDLQTGESFYSLLTQKSNVIGTICYKKTDAETYAISVYQVKAGDSLTHGGESTLGYEKAYPLKYYAHVPLEELLGPSKQETCHAKSLLQALKEDDQPIQHVFNPLNTYLEQPPEPIRLIKVEHDHPLKGTHAFLYQTIAESHPKNTEEFYKAILVVFRLLCVVGLFKSLENQKPENLPVILKLIEVGVTTVARHLEKQQLNVYLVDIYEQAVGSLNQIKQRLEELQRVKEVVSENSLNIELPKNQSILCERSSQKIHEFIQQTEENPVTFSLSQPNFKTLLFSHPPAIAQDFVLWLTEAVIKLEALRIEYEEAYVPALHEITKLLPLPENECIWFTLNCDQALEALEAILTLAKTLAEFAFKNKLRFSHEVQNTAASLLLYAHALAELHDENKLLSTFKPALKGFRGLTKSPYFFSENAETSAQRAHILNFVQSSKKDIWIFKHKDKNTFSTSGEMLFAEAFLAAHPEISLLIEQHTQALRYKYTINGEASLSEFFLAELLTDDPILDHQEPVIRRFYLLAKTAMHVLMLSDTHAKAQDGYANVIKLQKGFSFNLQYAELSKQKTDFLAVGNPALQLSLQAHRHLLPRAGWRQSQNQTIQRFMTVESTPQFYLEEALTEPGLSTQHLLSVLTSRLFLLNDSQIVNTIERYLFKIAVDEEGNEMRPFLDELKNHPHLITTVFGEFLNKAEILNNHLVVQKLAFHVYGLAEQLNCLPMLRMLDEYFLRKEEVWMQNLACPISLQSLLMWMEIQQPKNITWKEYFTLGSQFQLRIDQKDWVLNPVDQLWWDHLRYKMAKMYLTKHPKNKLDKDFDCFSLSHGRGRWLRIPIELSEHAEFIRLFSARIKYAKFDNEEHVYSINDPLLGQIRVYASDHILRLINGVWMRYISYTNTLAYFKIPACVAAESTWWLNPKTQEAFGFYLHQPSKIWLSRSSQGVVTFVDGCEKEKRLELVEETEAHCNFIQYYYAYHPRLMDRGFSANYRDSLIFPYIKSLNDEPLTFTRKNQGFYEKNRSDRQLIGYTFAPTYLNRQAPRLKSTTIKVRGIVIQKGKEQSLLLPFQRHFSEKHSPFVYGINENTKSMEPIEIKIHSRGFCPESPLQYLFAAYISLLGKDYFQAMRFLNTLRPTHILTDKERTVLCWLIESSNDHSVSAASVKLKAYQLWGNLTTPWISSLEQPKDSLESLYLTYLNHISSIPQGLHLDDSFEYWLVNTGFNLSIPQIYIKQEWKERLENGRAKIIVLNIHSNFQGAKIALLDQWRQSQALSQDSFEVPFELVDGLFTIKKQRLIPGKAYPYSSFGYHYQQLSSEDVSLNTKWKWIYQLETTQMPVYVRAGLIAAYQMGMSAPKLPLLEGLFNGQNRAIVHEWFKQFLDSSRVEIHVDIPEKKQIDHQTVHQRSLRSLKKAASIFNKNFKTKPLEILTVLKNDIVHEVVGKNEIETASPFAANLNDEEVFAREKALYHEEWIEGIKLLNQAKVYQVPDSDEIVHLQHLLTLYFNEVDAEALKLQLLESLNKGPDTLNVTLSEVTEDKVDIEFEDLLNTVFLSDDQQKLAYLKRQNPFLTLSDLKFIKKRLKIYLEAEIANNLLKQVQQKLEIEPDHPQFFHNWQEICKLLDQTEYSSNNQEYLENLLFEYISGFRVTAEQSGQIKAVVEKLFDEEREIKITSLIFKVIMNRGKTRVILPKFAKAITQMGKVPLFIVHHSQYASVKSVLANQPKRLGQDVVDLDFTRQDLSTLEVLQFIHRQLQDAKDFGRLLLMKTSFLLLLRSEFIDQFRNLCTPKHGDPLTFQRLKVLADILYFLKKKGVFIGDEIDTILNVLEEVNLPWGNSAAISQASLQVIKEVYVILTTHPKIKSLLNLIKDDQSLTSDRKLNQKIFPLLVDTLIEEYPPITTLIPLVEAQVFTASLKDYMLGNIRKDSTQHQQFLIWLEEVKSNPNSCFRKGLSAASLVRELCEEVLPLVLRTNYNKDYGWADVEKVIPYLGANSPNITEFGNPYVTASNYFQTAVSKGVSQEHLLHYRDKMREAAYYYSELYHCAPEQSAEAKHFQAITGLDLLTAWDEDLLEKTIENLNKDPRRVLDFYTEFSANAIRYHTQLINCGPIALESMASIFVGTSGTLANLEVFPRKMAENCLPQVGHEGIILNKLAFDFIENESSILPIHEPSVIAMLDAILTQSRQDLAQRLRAIIDVGAYLRHYSNLQVAQEILKYEPLKTEIEAVVFLKKEGDIDAFFLLKRGEVQPIILQSTTQKEIESHGVILDKVFVFFDQLRALGSDIPLKYRALSVFAFDPASTKMRDVLQGVMRARRFLQSQTIDFAVRTESLEQFYAYDVTDPLGCLTTQNLFDTAIRNQAKVKPTLLLRSALEQIRESYCSMIFIKLIKRLRRSAEEITGNDLKLYSNFEWLFYTHLVDDPITLYAHISSDVIAYEIVQNYATELHAKFEACNENLLSLSEVNSILANVRTVLDWSIATLTWKTTSLKQTANIKTEVMVQTQVENHVQVNVEVQIETELELQKYAIQVDAAPAKFIDWKILNELPISFTDYQPPPIVSIRKLFRRIPYEKPYHQIFPKVLYLTENFARSYEIDLSYFHRAQKQVSYFLLVKDQETFSTLYLDMKEASFWRTEIEKHSLSNCWLIDLEGRSLNENHTPPKDSKNSIEVACCWGYFLNGNVAALKNHPDFIRTQLKGELCQRFLQLRTVEDKNQSTILQTSPLFTTQSSQVPVFQFNDKQEEEEWLATQDVVCSVAELNAKPFHYARYFKNSQIPLICRKGYFSYLQTEQFEYVLPEQVQWIPDHCLQHLKTPEQIDAVVDEKIEFLKGEGLNFLNRKRLLKINPEQLLDLSSSLQARYQKAMIEQRGLEKFAKSIQPKMASAVLSQCVPHLNERCIPYLQTKAQLACLPIDKYSHVNAAQFHLLPEENWSLITVDQLRSYTNEEAISFETEPFIQQIDPKEINQLDPRLAAFYSAEQVAVIDQPQLIKYLKTSQLHYLNPSLSHYLSPPQIQTLDKRHVEIIETLEEIKSLRLLSSAAIGLLSLEQVLKFSDEQISRRLPYFNPEVLKRLNGSLIAQADTLPLDTFKQLTSKQVQCYLNGRSKIAIYLKEMTAEQWKGIEPLFLQSFFANKSKRILKYVPKNRIQFLAKKAFFKWCNVEKPSQHIKDVFKGLCSLLFYPLILLTGLFFALFSDQKQYARNQTLRPLFLAPLLLFSRENYYRNIV